MQLSPSSIPLSTPCPYPVIQLASLFLCQNSTIRNLFFDFFRFFFGDYAVIAGLKEKFEEAGRRNDVKAIVLTGNSAWIPTLNRVLLRFVLFDPVRPIGKSDFR